MYFRCYGNLKFLLTYNGKSETWHLVLFHCRYFDKLFSEMFIEWSSTKRIILVLTSKFDWLSWQYTAKFAKIFKHQLLRSNIVGKAETVQKSSSCIYKIILSLCAVAYIFWLLWQLKFPWTYNGGK